MSSAFLTATIFKMAADEARHFINEFPEFERGKTSFSCYDVESKQIVTAWKETLWKNITALLEFLEKSLQRDTDRKDCSVYTGTSGIALLYLQLAVKGSSDGESADYLAKALSYMEPALRSKLKGTHGPAFLCGEPGPLAVAAVIYHKLHRPGESRELLDRLQSLKQHVVSTESDLPDELLYGRMGYLYALMFVRKHIGEEAIDASIIKEVMDRTLRSGTRLSKKDKWKCPLMYKWHDQYYLGAAHGVSGILFSMIQASEFLSVKDLEESVKPTVDFSVSLRYPSGNYPSSIDSKSDRLVHWCHGAPGFIHLFAIAYQKFGDEVYLREALACGDVIWKRGILKKGYGICHGTAGNAYGFLALFRITGDEKHLYRAVKFSEWIFDYGQHGCRKADRPMSLFEGLAGTICFLVSMLDPWSAEFPAFYLGL